jgi:hypothetical protein
VEIEQLERKSNLRQDVPLDTAPGANEKWLDARISLDQGARNCKSGI